MATEGENKKRKRRGGKGKNSHKKTHTQNNNINTTSTSFSPQPNSHNKKSNHHEEQEGSNSSLSKLTKPSTFLDKMKARLNGGHFRMLNEKLYTCTGNEALKYFNDNPSLFNLYHTGYQEQMSHWPELPVNVIIKWLKDRSPSLVVADFGCGLLGLLGVTRGVEPICHSRPYQGRFVPLAATFVGDARLGKNVKNKVYSIDLVASDPSIIACDMSKTPLDSSSVDVAVFCLSLMGTDFPSYLQEAHRVLKPSGWLLIAEVKSRFDPNNGGADPTKFSNAICGLGYAAVSKDLSNKMFIMFYFKKKDKQCTDVKGIEWPELKPCLYKRR